MERLYQSGMMGSCNKVLFSHSLRPSIPSPSLLIGKLLLLLEMAIGILLNQPYTVYDISSLLFLLIKSPVDGCGLDQ